MIGVPICPTVSRTGEGIEHLFDTIIKVYEGKEPAVRHVHVRLSPDVENAVTAIKDALKEDKSINQHFSPRYLAIRLLEHDDEVEHIVSESAGASRVFTIRDKVVRELNKQHPEEDISDMIADDKYGFISGALAETIKRNGQHLALDRPVCNEPSVRFSYIPDPHGIHLLGDICRRRLSRRMD